MPTTLHSAVTFIFSKKTLFCVWCYLWWYHKWFRNKCNSTFLHWLNMESATFSKSNNKFRTKKFIYWNVTCFFLVLVLFRLVCIISCFKYVYLTKVAEVFKAFLRISKKYCTTIWNKKSLHNIFLFRINIFLWLIVEFVKPFCDHITQKYMYSKFLAEFLVAWVLQI